MYTLLLALICTHCCWHKYVHIVAGTYMYTLLLALICTHCCWHKYVHIVAGTNMYTLLLAQIRTHCCWHLNVHIECCWHRNAHIRVGTGTYTLLWAQSSTHVRPCDIKGALFMLERRYPCSHYRNNVMSLRCGSYHQPKLAAAHQQQQ